MQVFYFMMSYIFGNFMTAELLSKWRGVKLSEQGSGNIGARNAGRVLGKDAFFWTVLGDGGKVLLVIIIGHAFALPITTIAIGCTLCVIGHLHPFWLRFKGGMGVATCISAMLFLTPWTILVFLAGAALFFAFSKSLTLSMIAGFLTYSIGLWWLEPDAWPLLIAVALVTWYHRASIQERLQKK